MAPGEDKPKTSEKHSRAAHVQTSGIRDPAGQQWTLCHGNMCQPSKGGS